MSRAALLALLICTAYGQHLLTGECWTSESNSTKVLDAWIGTKLPIVMVYDTFCAGWIFPQIQDFWDAGQVPMFSFQIENFNCGDNKGNTAVTVANGEQDSYLHWFFNTTKQWLAGPNKIYGDSDDRRMYMRLAHEMNGNWYPWSGNATAYKLAWRRVWGIAQEWKIDDTRMQWVWCPNTNDVGGVKAEDYYPGSDVVHWVGIDGYNDAKHDSWSKWDEPNDVFGDMMNRIKAIAPGKPIAIPETGCATDGYTPQNKSVWIEHMFSYALKNNIKMLLWFNIEGSYADYAVFDSRNGAQTYKSPVNGKTYKVYESYATQVRATTVPLTPNNPRIITDDQFKGNF